MQKFEYKILQGRRGELERWINEEAEREWILAFFSKLDKDQIGINVYLFVAVLKRPKV